MNCTSSPRGDTSCTHAQDSGVRCSIGNNNCSEVVKLGTHISSALCMLCIKREVKRSQSSKFTPL